MTGSVPNADLSGVTPSCAGVGLASDCCLYVWWPANENDEGDAGLPYHADPASLCTANDTRVVGFDVMGKNCPTPLRCSSPGGGGCWGCSGIE